MSAFMDFLGSAFVGFILGFILAAGAVTLIDNTRERQEWQKETVERGLAMYCPKTGDWAWKGECDE